MTLSERIVTLSRAQRALLEWRLKALGSDAEMAAVSAEANPLGPTGSITTGHAESSQPLTVTASGSQASLEDWIANNRSWLNASLLDSGAVLLRGFCLDGAAGFEVSIERAFGRTTDYPGLAQGVVLRKQIHGKIYTSTEYSSAFPILQHNECAFAHSWPAQICFYCVEPPASGGETPIADSREVLERISLSTRQRLETLGVLYVRNFGYGESRSWQKAFATDDQAAVEKICRAEGVACEWLDNSRLRTSARRPAVATHPVTGEAVWFNHINASHLSSLQPELRDALMSEFGKEGLPRNCYYGDGSEIEQGVLDEIHAAYRECTRTFQWRAGDVLFLDNMLSSHGRNPFTGSRKIAVGMAGSITR